MSNNYPLIPRGQQEIVTDNFIDLREVLNTTGLYYYLKSDPRYDQVKSHIASYFTGLFERKLNQDFHNSLSIIQQLGFFTSTKYQRHMVAVGLKKEVLAGGIYGILTILPAAIDYIAKTIQTNKLKEFVIGWLAYINKDDSTAVRFAADRFYRKILKEDFNQKQFIRIYENCMSVDKKPIMHDSFKKNPQALYSYIVSASDIENDDVRNRALEFGDYLDIQTESLEDTMALCKDSAEVLSNLSTFTSYSLSELFSDIVKSAEHAKQYAEYCIDNDPNALQRVRNKKLVLKGGALIAATALTVFTGPVGDAVLVAGSGIVNSLINEELDFKKGAEIGKRLRNAIDRNPIQKQIGEEKQ